MIYAFSYLEILILSHDTNSTDSHRTMRNGENSFGLASIVVLQFPLKISLLLPSFRHLGLNPGCSLKSPGELLKSKMLRPSTQTNST